MVLVLGDAVGIAVAGNRDRQAAVGDLTVGNDGAVIADDNAGAVFDGLAWRRPRDLRAGRKRIKRARHRNHHRLHGAFGGLVVENGEDANLVALGLSADVELLQALHARQHEEIRLDHGVFDLASGRLLLFLLGELCGAGAGLLAPRKLNLDGAGGGTPFGAVGVGGLLRHELRRDAEPRAGAGFGDDLPADILLPPLRGLGEHAALLRIEHAGLLAAFGFLEFLDGGYHALADLARYGAVVLAHPGQVRLDRLALRLRHGIGGIGRALQGGADRNGRDRLRLAALGGRRRHLRLGGGA